MRTGEGKTLVGTLPAYLNGLTGDGVHVVTVNDYLAKRDAEWMGRVHRFLGLTVGTILSGEQPAHRREQYACDITYGTNNEFGFDYLRDNMAWSKADLVQRGHHFAIVDEVDSILIDEARTPLIISGPAETSAKWYGEFARLMPLMKKDRHYEVEEAKRTVAVTEEGVEFVEDQLGIENLYEAANTPLIGYLNNALKARSSSTATSSTSSATARCSSSTSSPAACWPGRYNEGMHQAIEAKEKVKIKDENQTLATITLQNYFRLYEKLSGMTGTAQTEAAELHQTYKLGVVPIPTNRPMVREDQLRRHLQDGEGQVRRRRRGHRRAQAGQPVLVGTASVEKSGSIKYLLKRGIPHEVLNAKNHAREAQIVAAAGQLGGGHRGDQHGRPRHRHPARRQPGVHRRRGPAGRGLRRRRRRRSTRPPGTTPGGGQDQVKAEHEQVIETGGPRAGHRAAREPRIDNQLRGRSGRQGDPGNRFYLSLGDDLDAPVQAVRCSVDDDDAAGARRPADRVEDGRGRSCPRRRRSSSRTTRSCKDVLKYDEVLNRQRTVIYDERRKVLEGADLHEQVRTMVDDVIGAICRRRDRDRVHAGGLGPRAAVDRAQGVTQSQADGRRSSSTGWPR